MKPEDYMLDIELPPHKNCTCKGGKKCAWCSGELGTCGEIVANVVYPIPFDPLAIPEIQKVTWVSRDELEKLYPRRVEAEKVKGVAE